jgi:hypothetical protein
MCLGRVGCCACEVDWTGLGLSPVTKNVLFPEKVISWVTVSYSWMFLLYRINVSYDKSRDSSVGITMGYGLWKTLVRYRILLYFIPSRPALGFTQAPIQSERGGSFPAGESAGAWIWQLTSNSAEVKNGGLYLHSPISLDGMENSNFMLRWFRTYLRDGTLLYWRVREGILSRNIYSYDIVSERIFIVG